MIHLYLRTDTRLNFRVRRGGFRRALARPMAKEERRLLLSRLPGRIRRNPLIESSEAAAPTFISLLSRLMNLSFPPLASHVMDFCAKFRTSSIPLPFFATSAAFREHIVPPLVEMEYRPFGGYSCI